MIQDWHQIGETTDGQLPTKVVFVSDLHLFSSRSVAEQRRYDIDSAITWADLVIWGGDLFDFRWSRLKSEHETTKSAVEWLRQWNDQFASKKFIYLRGNHDVHPAFETRLNQWAKTQPNFIGIMEALQIQHTLFVHGDVIEKGGTTESFARYREKWSQKRPAGSFHNRAYDAAVYFRLHAAVAGLAHRDQRTCRRIATWISNQPNSNRLTIQRVAFGHTHRQIKGAHVDGITFYNGGAAIRHVPFEPIRLEF